MDSVEHLRRAAHFSTSADWMVSTVAGLEIADAGYTKILFKPRPGGTIIWAEAELKTPQGLVAIRWELKGDTLELALTVPEKSTAELSLPAGWTAKTGPLAAGSHKLVAKRGA